LIEGAVDMHKSQSDVISAMLILMISIGLVYTAFSWGLPLIQKKQDEALVSRVANYFSQQNANSLPKKIEFIANKGGTDTFNLDVEGVWTINETENSISFFFSSLASNVIQTGEWVSLTEGTDCSFQSSAPVGILGSDSSSIVCVKVEKTTDRYEYTYKVWFRELDSSDGTRGYKISLVKEAGGVSSSTGKSVRISQGDTTQQQQGQKLLTVTKINILLG